MDLNRYYRARVAGRMQMVDQRRKLFLQGKIKGKDLDAAEWKLITQMDEWEQD
jgi:hypothetical protein